MSKVVQLKTRSSVTRAARVRALLKDRDRAEAEIAAILREQLDELGEAKWLAWCEREFGWARTSAYRHLNPKLLEKAKQAQAERRANVPTLERDTTDDDIAIEADLDGEDPENYRTAYLLRAEQALRFATYSGPITSEIVATARAVAAAWTKLARHLEKSI